MYRIVALECMGVRSHDVRKSNYGNQYSERSINQEQHIPSLTLYDNLVFSNDNPIFDLPFAISAEKCVRLCKPSCRY